MSNLLPSQRTVFTAPEKANREWILIDARDQVLGRLAGRIAHRVRGKHRADYAPHQELGDHVVVINARHIKVTGKKLDQKTYHEHSGYPGGLRDTILRIKMGKEPTYALKKAVERMLPKGKLGRKLLKHVRIFADAAHGHAAQQPKAWAPVFK